MSGQTIENKIGRSQPIETLRILAAFGIVAYHSQAKFHDLAYSGLIVFLVLSPMMDTRYNWGRLRTISMLARSLLLPWAFWMCVYGARNIAMHDPLLPAGNLIGALLYGTSAHLWFLPFIFMVLALLNLAKSRTQPIWLLGVCTVGAVLILATVSLWRAESLAWPKPLPQWMHSVAPVLVGVAFGLTGRFGKFAWLAPAVIFCGIILAANANLPGVSIPYAVGILLTAIVALPQARWWPTSWDVQAVADCMMGVYLSHILFLQIAGKIAGQANYLTVVVAFMAAVLFVWTARRLFPSSRLVLG